ncbi:MAG: 1-acyl-sn-glycerol-3-phosphate acyltransferase [Bacteroidales bacterium]|nr:1-acyl-sn-glycerol-3-phosphate acyltransferase [Bacteroidales bacterium]
MPQQTQNQFEQIDIKKIFYGKSPKIARWIPGFVFKYLKKITHEKELNQLINNYGHLKDFEFSAAMIKLFNITITVEGEENLPKEGRYIFASNHPLGGLDGHILMYLVGRKYGSYKFLVNDLLMKLKNLHGVFIPVNKHGRQSLELAQKLDEAYQSDAQILTFPAGLVSRRIKGRIIDLEWHKSFITKAKQYKRNIVPVHMSGNNSNFFYNLGRFRKKLGIKANIEMLYLIDEAYKHKDKHITVKFGKPISWETFDTSKRPGEWAKWVKEISYRLDGVENLPF